MKTVSAIVLYRGNKITRLTVNHRGNQIPMIYPASSLQLSECTCFNDMYKQVLGLLKANKMSARYEMLAEAKWYDIAWIDLNNPNICRYAYREKTGGSND